MRFIIDHDMHLHSQLSLCSGDPGQTTHNLLRYAKEMGFRKICLTDHFWDEGVEGASDWYKKQDYAHIAKALPLPQEEGIVFDFGCETDFDRFMKLGISDKRMGDFAFIIVPTSHLHMSGFTRDESARTVSERAKLYMERNHALLDMDLPFEKMGLAHFTCPLLARNCEGGHADIINAISDSAFAELFERIAKSGMGVELNMPQCDCASAEILRPYRIARERGCKFYLGSDAHTPRELMHARTRFEAMVDALGLSEDDKFALARK